MKKRIFILIIILLLTTGCTCEYNLTINENTYKEEITLIGETSQEISQFDNEWKIPVDKEEYELIAGLDGTYTPDGDIYKYNLSNNRITFNYDFSKNNYNDSTAVANCYNKLTITNYNDTIVISTSPKVDCFDKYPTLSNIKVNIKADKSVISNNADSVNNNIYTWNISKENINDKSINIVLNNDAPNGEDKTEIPDEIKQNKSKGSYDLYILLIILVVVGFIGYKLFMKFKERNNDID